MYLKKVSPFYETNVTKYIICKTMLIWIYCGYRLDVSFIVYMYHTSYDYLYLSQTNYY